MIKIMALGCYLKRQGADKQKIYLISIEGNSLNMSIFFFIIIYDMPRNLFNYCNQRCSNFSGK